ASDWTNEASSTTLAIPPPAAPTGLTATAVPLSWTQITLSWTDNSNNETAFKIYRKSGSGAYALVGLAVPNSTSYTDTTASAATSYTYRVRAANDYWPSNYTNEVTATTNPSIPAAPTGLAAAVVGPGQISLSWIDHSNNETA